MGNKRINFTSGCAVHAFFYFFILFFFYNNHYLCFAELDLMQSTLDTLGNFILRGKSHYVHNTDEVSEAYDEGKKVRNKVTHSQESATCEALPWRKECLFLHM